MSPRETQHTRQVSAPTPRPGWLLFSEVTDRKRLIIRGENWAGLLRRCPSLLPAHPTHLSWQQPGPRSGTLSGLRTRLSVLSSLLLDGTLPAFRTDLSQFWPDGLCGSTVFTEEALTA